MWWSWLLRAQAYTNKCKEEEKNNNLSNETATKKKLIWILLLCFFFAIISIEAKPSNCSFPFHCSLDWDCWIDGCREKVLLLLLLLLHTTCNFFFFYSLFALFSICTSFQSNTKVDKSFPIILTRNTTNIGV